MFPKAIGQTGGSSRDGIHASIFHLVPPKNRWLATIAPQGLDLSRSYAQRALASAAKDETVAPGMGLCGLSQC